MQELLGTRPWDESYVSDLSRMYARDYHSLIHTDFIIRYLSRL